MNEVALVESSALRAEYTARVGVLDKVKALSLLPDDTHASTEMVASYYEVDREAVNGLVHDHRKELESNGLRVVRGDELRKLKSAVPEAHLFKQASTVRLFPRRAILNTGMLLRDSDIARQVRSYLLNVEETADTPQRDTAAAFAAELAPFLIAALKEAEALPGQDVRQPVTVMPKKTNGRPFTVLPDGTVQCGHGPAVFRPAGFREWDSKPYADYWRCSLAKSNDKDFCGTVPNEKITSFTRTSKEAE